MSKTPKQKKGLNHEEMKIKKANQGKREQSIKTSLLLAILGPLVGLLVYFVGPYGYLLWNEAIQIPELHVINKNEYWGPYPMDPKPDLSIRPFNIEFTDVMINDLRERLLHQRQFVPPIEESGSKYGINSNFLTKVLDFWKNKYDFKQREHFFNKYHHYVTKIQGLDIHYMHVEPVFSADIKVVTLLMLHSWPGSIREFYDIIPKLTAPNPKYKFVFEVIAPSLPGFGFSQAAVRSGMSPVAMAVVIANLMDRIGRRAYYVTGGDIGHAVGSLLATLTPNVLGFHTNTPQINHLRAKAYTAIACHLPRWMFSLEPQFYEYNCPVESTPWNSAPRSYKHSHETMPDTLGIGLTDSPAGLSAYILDEISRRTNPAGQRAEDGELRTKYSLTQLLDNVMVYWATGAITTSMRVHYEALTQYNYDRIPTNVPAWGIKFKHNPVYSPDFHLGIKYKNYLHTTVVEAGGMFAAMESPQVLADDIYEAVHTFRAFHASKISKPQPAETVAKSPTTIYDFTVTTITGEDLSLSKYRGYVVLIVNVASQCGLTDKNYEQLVMLHEKYAADGLRILAFPCNQFGSQEPGSARDILQFTTHKGVQFDVFAKVDVNGDSAHPLWKFLKSSQGGSLGDWVKWNFSKFLVGRDGLPAERFGPNVDPMELEPHIVKLLGNY